jgi:type III secretory pathway component EscR
MPRNNEQHNLRSCCCGILLAMSNITDSQPQVFSNATQLSVSQPYADLNQDDKSIRKTAIILLVVSLLAGSIALLVWALMMKQYNKGFRIGWFIFSGIIIPLITLFIIIFGAAIGLSDSGTNGIVSTVIIFGSLPINIILFLLPFLYTIKWPLGRDR